MFFSFLFLFSVYFCRYDSSDIVDPQRFPQRSIPVNANVDAYKVNGVLLPSYVYDPEGYLKPGTYKQVNFKLASLRKDTDVEFCIIIVDHIKPRETPYAFTKAVFDRFGVGDRIDNNGVVLSLLIEDRKMEFVHGKGMNKLLRNSQYDNIIEEMKDYLRNRDFDQAVLYAVNSIQYRVANPPSFLLRILYFFQDNIIFDICLVIGVAFLISFIMNRVGARRVFRRESQYRAEVDGIRQHLQNPSASSKPIFSPVCAICMERFSDEHIHRNEAYARIVEKRQKEAMHPDVPSGVEEENIDWSVDTGVETFPKCGHQFHRACISSWLQTSNTCPICRVARPREPKNAQPPASSTRGERGPGNQGYDDGCESSSSSSSFFSHQHHHYYPPAQITLGDVGFMLAREHFNMYYNPFSYYNQWRMISSLTRAVGSAVLESSREHGGSSGHHFGGGSSSGGGHRGGSW